MLLTKIAELMYRVLYTICRKDQVIYIFDTVKYIGWAHKIQKTSKYKKKLILLILN